jgi:hypothetical protein
MDRSDASTSVARPRRRWWRWPVRLGLLLLVGLLATAGHLWWQHRQLSQQVEEAVAELDRTDPSWRLHEIEAAREVIPDEENSAPRVRAIVRLLPKGWDEHPCYKEEQDLHLNPNERLPPQQAAQLKSLLP